MSRYVVLTAQGPLTLELMPTTHHHHYDAQCGDEKISFEILAQHGPHYVLRLTNGRIVDATVSTQSHDHIIDHARGHFAVNTQEIFGATRLDDILHGSGHADLKAPMPGQIIAIHKNVGDAVQKGDALIVIEAMKMQNALKSPATGTISAIHVSTGTKAEAGQILLSIG